VTVPLPVIEGFVELRWLRADQRDDLAAILAAMRRLGWTPTVTRIA
jgi:hypothetical protein